MVREQKGCQHPPLFFNAVAIGFDFHSLFAYADTRRRQQAAADIDDAQAANADRLQARTVAQRGNVDAMLSGGLPDGRARRHGDESAVESDMDR
jgi:hypothetical protein